MNDGNDCPVTAARLTAHRRRADSGNSGGTRAAQSCAIRRAPSSRASPAAPWRMTMSWFQANAGRATGPSTFIQGRVVRTRHSYTAAVPWPSNKPPGAVALELAGGAALDQVRRLDARDARVEAQLVGQHAAPGEAVLLADAVGVAGRQCDDALDALPPIRVARGVAQHVEDAVDRRVDAPCGQKLVLGHVRENFIVGRGWARRASCWRSRSPTRSVATRRRVRRPRDPGARSARRTSSRRRSSACPVPRAETSQLARVAGNACDVCTSTVQNVALPR